MPSVLQVKELGRDGLVHGFSTLEIGSVGLTHAPDPAPVHAARATFARLLDLDPATLTTVGAVHGAGVARIDPPRDVVKDVDALITDSPGIALFATYADCYPIVLWDPTHRAAALAHAGWRGTEAGVATAALKAMEREFATDPEDVQAAIGPGICGRCYEVGDEVARRFDERFVVAKDNGKFLLDLAAANRGQLENEGVTNVSVCGLCTRETDFLPSHRRAPDGTRFGAIVAIR